MNELAKRVVDCKNWKWIPGMRCIDPVMGWAFRAVRGADNYGKPAIEWVMESDHGATIGRAGVNRVAAAVDDGPDLTDPATIGCLLDLVRKVWHTAPANVNCHMSYSPDRGHYRNWTCSYCTGEKWEQTIGETEAEALVLALEASNV